MERSEGCPLIFCGFANLFTLIEGLPSAGSPFCFLCKEKPTCFLYFALIPQRFTLCFFPFSFMHIPHRYSAIMHNFTMRFSCFFHGTLMGSAWDFLSSSRPVCFVYFMHNLPILSRCFFASCPLPVSVFSARLVSVGFSRQQTFALCKKSTCLRQNNTTDAFFYMLCSIKRPFSRTKSWSIQKR